MGDNNHWIMSSSANLKHVPVLLDARVTYRNAPAPASGYTIIVKSRKADGDPDTKS